MARILVIFWVIVIYVYGVWPAIVALWPRYK